jgi:hypothetical protein
MNHNGKQFPKEKMPLSKDIDRAWVHGKITGQEAQGLSDSNPHLRGKYNYNGSSEEQITAIHKKAGLSREE